MALILTILTGSLLGEVIYRGDFKCPEEQEQYPNTALLEFVTKAEDGKDQEMESIYKVFH